MTGGKFLPSISGAGEEWRLFTGQKLPRLNVSFTALRAKWVVKAFIIVGYTRAEPV